MRGFHFIFNEIFTMKKIITSTVFVSLFFLFAAAQKGELLPQRWSLHFQATLIPQYHFPFSANYTASNSLLTKEPVAVSFTSTMFAGLRLWKNASIYINPEIAAGSGLSKATGVAGFVNGETFRIGSPSLKLYLARLYFEQKFPLGNSTEPADEGLNQLRGNVPQRYISVTAGKFSVADFFDCNAYSHDPRTQFLNWSLMSAGAWDYPANTRGYTLGVVAAYHATSFSLRGGITQVPEYANGPSLDNNIGKAFGTALEAEKKICFYKNNSTVIKIGVFYNQANMGNYDEAIMNGMANFRAPDIISTRKYSRSKMGIYFNLEHSYKNGGAFFRASWNDGKNETWAFTEIDKSLAAGISLNGKEWNRAQDILGVALVFNGLSTPHQTYLQHGGYGFIIGDGNLNYGSENILELYYALHFQIKIVHLYCSPDYQFVLHPAYNIDRGPAHMVGIRLHAEI